MIRIFTIIVTMLYITSANCFAYKFIVAGNQKWQDTGVYISKGDIINFTATGTVCHHYCLAKHDYKDPRGCCPKIPDPCGGRNKNDKNLVPSVWSGALVAKIGNGSGFYIGDVNTITAQESGNLHLANNDSYYGDNKGNHVVTFTIEKESKVAPPQPVVAKEVSVTRTKKPPQPAVDKEIPVTGMKNPHGIAVVIGNRNYKSGVPPVDYAIKDAKKVKEYLLKTLGFKEGNIILKIDATLSDFLVLFGSKEKPRARLYNLVGPNADCDVFVYYSGHGAPDARSKTRYLLPVDCKPMDITLSSFPVDQLFMNLSKINCRSMTVVMDACFSGLSEGGSITRIASPIGIELGDFPEMTIQNGAVFTSADKNEISSWYPKMEHSLFTYFFLKALGGEADSNGDKIITILEIYDFVRDNSNGVPYHARLLSTDRTQTPQLYSSNPDRILVRLIKD